MLAGGSINVTTTLLVDFILTSNKISIKSVDDLTGQILSTFTIENTSTGILIIKILFLITIMLLVVIVRI